MHNIITTHHSYLIQQTKTYAEQWLLTYQPNVANGIFIELTPLGLTLNYISDTKKLTLALNFNKGKYGYRREHQSHQQHPLLQAIKIKHHSQLSIIDYTAGLAGDSLLMASAGHSVLMIERQPLLALLVDTALIDFLSHHSNYHIKLQLGEAKEITKQLLVQPDIAYLDPMYPEKKNTAAVKKEAQLLRLLNNTNEINKNNNLLKDALAFAKNKVVVKRPIWALPLDDIKPNKMIKMKKHRFDIYTCNN